MAERKIIWSHRARIKLFAILEFYAKRNKSKTYSAKLYTKFNKEIKLLAKYPNLGIKTEIESVRGLIINEYFIYYEPQQDHIIIHTIWDSRQDPDSLVIK
ncbi:MAG TPA: type II toxin-antitoxin system RelE/ParE family toxin [Cyclobacteriaceae bacterium]|nr:type II toxin-antitoxin system RelE/ParE family toxin [Cyclobacteriaceae bacterium]